jgi:hypothetical protein
MKAPGLFVRLRRFFGWVWFIGGAATIGVAIVFVITTAVFIHKATVTSGKILDLIPVADNEDNAINYAPVFTFTAADGRSYTATSSVATNPPGFAVGQAVRVLYDPRNPSDARLKSTAQLWMVPLICVPIALVLSALGGVALWFDRRYRRRVAASAAAPYPAALR